MKSQRTRVTDNEVDEGILTH